MKTSDYECYRKKIKRNKFTDLKIGHILEEDLQTKSGALILKKGKVIAWDTIAILLPYAEEGKISEPIVVK